MEWVVLHTAPCLCHYFIRLYGSSSIHNTEKYIYISEILNYNINMLNEFAIAQIPASGFISLKALWVVKADPSYDVYKGGIFGSELVLVRTINGRGMLVAEGMEPFCLDAGTLLIVELQKIRRYYCSTKQWDFWWFEFYSAKMPDLFLYKVMHAPYLEREEEKVIGCMRELHKDDWLSQHAASSSFSVLLYSWLKGANVLYSSLPYEKEIRETALYMQENLGKKISIQRLAQRMGVCDKYFRQLFKAVYHMSPKKYYNQLRMKTAEALIMNTNLNVSEISEKLGFYSSFHFTREFKKHCGKAPTDFRAKNCRKAKPVRKE